MTFEEINQTLQTVAQSQARFDKTVKQIAEAHKTLIELLRVQDGRIDSHDMSRREADERLDALINSQIRLTERVDTLTRNIEVINGRAAEHEASQEKLEESFRLVASSHSQLVEIIRLHESRLDGDDEAQARTDGRLDALIDDQISARAQAEERGRLLDEKLARLQEAQAQADEQIRMLVARNGGAK